MKCKNCGAYIDDNASFCTNCGARQDRPETPVQPAAPAAASGKVTFLDACKLFFTRYVDFNGRSSRSEFWYAYLGLFIVGTLLNLLARNVEYLTWLPNLWNLAVMVPSIAVTIRRLHDAGKEGTYYLWVLLPVAGVIMLLVQCAKPSQGDNKFGPAPRG